MKLTVICRERASLQAVMNYVQYFFKISENLVEIVYIIHLFVTILYYLAPFFPQHSIWLLTNNHPHRTEGFQEILR